MTTRWMFTASANPRASALILLAAVGVASAAKAQEACPKGMIDGSPPVSGQHIFCGEINSRSRATGFHSRPGGINPASVSDTGTEEPVRGHPGLYHLRNFRVTQRGRTAMKGLSTLYPDNCSEADVVAAVRHAFTTGTRDGPEFTGSSGKACTDRSGRPFRIKGFTARDSEFHIVTAYPDY